jgi:hypothetical protein
VIGGNPVNGRYFQPFSVNLAKAHAKWIGIDKLGVGKPLIRSLSLIKDLKLMGSPSEMKKASPNRSEVRAFENAVYRFSM